MSNLDGFIAERGGEVSPELRQFNEELKDKEAYSKRPLLCKLHLHSWQTLFPASMYEMLSPKFKCTKCRKESY